MPKMILKKDIVIPAGTIFDDAPVKTVRVPGAYIDTVIGLTKDTAGFFTYETGLEELDEWFEEYK